MATIMNTSEKKRRVKQRFQEMYPIKKWLSLDEASAFMDMSVNPFQDMVRQYGLTVSTLPPINGSKRSNKKYYLVNELEALIEKGIGTANFDKPKQFIKK